MYRVVILSAIAFLAACQQRPSSSSTFLLPTLITHELSGTVSSAAGDPIAGATVTFITGRRATTVTAASARGFYRIGGLEPGTVVVTISAPGFTASTRALLVTTDVVFDVSLDPLPSATLPSSGS